MELFHGINHLIFNFLGDEVKFLGDFPQHVDDKLAEENDARVLILIIPELLEQIPAGAVD